MPGVWLLRALLQQLRIRLALQMARCHGGEVMVLWHQLPWIHGLSIGFVRNLCDTLDGCEILHQLVNMLYPPYNPIIYNLSEVTNVYNQS